MNGLTLAAAVLASSLLTAAQTDTGTPANVATSYYPQFTISATADNGQNILANVYNTTAVQAQSVCPGYKASDVQQNKYGFTASLSLAGAPVC